MTTSNHKQGSKFVSADINYNSLAPNPLNCDCVCHKKYHADGFAFCLECAKFHIKAQGVKAK